MSQICCKSHSVEDRCIMLAVILCFSICVSAVLPQNTLDLEEGDICEVQGEDLWSCQKLSQCPMAQEIVRKKGRPTICGYIGRESVVCCQPPGSTVTLKLASTKSEEKCREYAKAVYMNYSDPMSDEINQINTCALVEPTIVGGMPAQPREYPHMALIGFGDNPIWKCGGSLISEQYVLSAAHCWGEARWVRLGEYNMNSIKDDKNKEAQPKDYEIEKRIDHPEYKKTGIANDITLYRLKQRVTFNEYIRPLCLQREHTFDKTFAIVTGWGRTEPSGPRSDVLLKVNLTIIENKECVDFYKDPSKSIIRATDEILNGITGGAMLCAGDLVEEKDACQHDSGGPLQIRLKDPYCMYSQVGIVSAGFMCAKRHPGIYTRISHYVPWIESIVWP